MCVSPNRHSESPYIGLPPSQLLYQGKTQNIQHQMHQQRIQRQMQQLYMDKQCRIDSQQTFTQTQQTSTQYRTNNMELGDSAADIFGNMASDPALCAWYPVLKPLKYPCSPHKSSTTAANQLSGTVRLADRHRRSIVDPNSSLQTSTGTTPTLKSNTMAYTRATSTTDGNMDVQQIPLNNPYMAVIYPPARCVNNNLGAVPSPGSVLPSLSTYQPHTVKMEYPPKLSQTNPVYLKLDVSNQLDSSSTLPVASNFAHGKPYSRKRASQQVHYGYSQIPQKRIHLCHPLTNRVNPSRLKLQQRHQYQVRMPQLQRQVQHQHLRMQSLPAVRHLVSRSRDASFPSCLSSQSGLSISPLSPSYVKQVRTYVDDLEFKENREERDMLQKEIVDLHYKQFVGSKK